MVLPKDHNLLTIAKAAKKLGVSTKTLRRWEKQGMIIPKRTLGNQRRYAISQIENLQDFKSHAKDISKFSAKGLHLLHPWEDLTTVCELSNNPHYSIQNLVNIIVRSKKHLLLGGISGFFLFFIVAFFQPTSFLTSDFSVSLGSSRSEAGQGGPAVLGVETLGAETINPNFVFNVNVPANFNDKALFAKDVEFKGKIIAPNFIYSILGGDGISVTTTEQNPTIKNTGVLSLGGKTGALKLEAGSGITIDGLKVTNSGITSLTAGGGISVSGSTITNSDLGSSVMVFKTISVSGQSNVVADSNTDTLTFAAGTGITLTTDASNDKLTIAGTNPGVTDGGTSVYVTTTTDNFAIGQTEAIAKLAIEASSGDLITASSSGSQRLTLSNSGNLILAGAVNIGGVSGKNYNAIATSLQSASQADVSSSNDLYLGGDLEIGGTIYGTLNGGMNAGFTEGSVVFTDSSGNLSADSSNFNFNNTTNTLSLANLSIGSYLYSNLVPATGSQYDLGSSARRWSSIYADTISATTLSVVNTDIAGTTAQDFLINSDYIGDDAQSATLTFERGSPAVNSQFKWDATNKYISSNAPFAILPDSGITYSGTAALIVNQIQNQDIFSASASGATKFVINNSGNVGIGTTNPAASLSVGSTSQFQVSSAGAVTAVGVNSGSGLIQGTGGITVTGTGNINTTGTSATNIGNSTGALTLASGGTSAWTNTGGNLTLSTATSGTLALTSAGALNLTAGAANPISLTSSNTTGTTTSSAFSFAANSVTTGTGLYLASSSITEGKLLHIASTSTALTSGNLLALDWSPGSSTTGTGDLFSINMGANALGSTLLNLKDNGSSIFSVSQTAVTTSLPTSFTSTGDVSVAYDLNMTNPTASFIKSSAPLYLQAGAVFDSSDLTLGTYHEGSVVLSQDNQATTANTSYALQVLPTLSSSTDSLTYTALYGIYNVPAVNMSGNAATDLTTLYSSYAGLTATAGTIGTWYGYYADAPTGSGTVSTAYGMSVAALSNATSYGVNVGNLSGTTANYGVNIGNLTSAATANNFGLKIGTITSQASATSYGILTGAISGAGTATYGINLGANSSTATTNYGMKIGAISGAGTTNYGLYVDSVSGASTNFSIYSNGGTNYFSGNVGIGTTNPTAKLQIAGDINVSNYATISAGLSLGTASVDGGVGNASMSGTLTVNTIKPSTGALNLQYKSGGNSWTNALSILDNTGYVGINTSGSDRRLDVLDASNSQIRATYTDGSVYTDFQTDSSGNFKLNNTGGTYTLGRTTSGTVSLTSSDDDSTAALSIDSGGTGALNLGTGANAKTITLGNNTTTTALAFTSGTGSQTFTSKVVSGTTTSSGFVFDAGDITTGTGMYLTSDSITQGKLLDINTGSANTLTTGTLLNLASTATSLTSGSLLTLDWSPGSSTTGTGDLFSINMGANALGSTLLNLKDNGSSIFSVSQTGITAAIPASFNASGDVSMAYDLVFTNSTASFIKSQAPLAIVSGEVYDSSNLTLSTYNSGQIVFDAAGGVTLNQAQNWNLAGSTTAMNIRNASGTSIINIDSTNNRIGIGTTAPLTALDIVGSASASANLTLKGAGTAHIFNILDNGTLDFRRSPGGDAGVIAANTVLFINSNGFVGIGTATPSAKFQVGDQGDGTAATANSWNSFSDLRFKDNILEIPGSTALSKVMALKGVTFNWKNSGDPSVGFIAQDVEKIIPEIVTTDSQGYKSMDYSKIMPYVISAMHEQENKFNSLESQMRFFEARMNIAATSSAFLSLTGLTANEDIDIETATISGSLMVLGRTVLSDVGIIGNINAGLISINGLDGKINTLSGPLRFQSDGFYGIDILNGKITIDKDGNFVTEGKVTAKTLATEEMQVLGAKTIGSSEIPANKTSVEIESEAVDTKSKIFLTPTVLTSKQLAVTSKKAGKFRVEVGEGEPFPITFDWWIVGN